MCTLITVSEKNVTCPTDFSVIAIKVEIKVAHIFQIMYGVPLGSRNLNLWLVSESNIVMTVAQPTAVKIMERSTNCPEHVTCTTKDTQHQFQPEQISY